MPLLAAATEHAELRQQPAVIRDRLVEAVIDASERHARNAVFPRERDAGPSPRGRQVARGAGSTLGTQVGIDRPRRVAMAIRT